jgi:membrane protease YdiL (CAAX protease family)
MAPGFRHPPKLWLAPGNEGATGAFGIAYAWFGAALMIALGLGAYRFFVKWFESRRPTEVARPFAAELSFGSIVGSGLVFAIAGTLALNGQFRIIGSSGWFSVLVPLAAAATAAVMEELLVRGLLFRVLEERLGSWIALATTALIFGAIHASNRGATAWSTLAVALSAGIVLGSAFILTRRLWLAFGLHFGVNSAQGAILGVPVSGQQTPGLLRSELIGQPLWTGGSFGLEASLLTLLFGVLIGGAFLALARRRGRIRPANFHRVNS